MRAYCLNKYWDKIIAEEEGTINKINVKTQEILTMDNLGAPGAIAVDWITNNIYFNDDNRPNVIKVNKVFLYNI